MVENQTSEAEQQAFSAESIERALPVVIDSIRKNDAETLFDIITNGGFPVEHKIDSYTLVQFAVIHAPGFEVVQALLQCGADLTRKTMNGRNVVHLCCRANRPDML